VKEQDWNVDGVELSVRLRILNPKRVSSETLSFCVGWVCGERLLTKSTGWRVQGGKILTPCVRTPKGYISTASVHDSLLEQLISLLQTWRPLYKGVEFPDASGTPNSQVGGVKKRPFTPEAYARAGAYTEQGSWVSADGLCCRCYITKNGWTPAKDCPAHEFPETSETKSETQAS
jgi:hypothetical protein